MKSTISTAIVSFLIGAAATLAITANHGPHTYISRPMTDLTGAHTQGCENSGGYEFRLKEMKNGFVLEESINVKGGVELSRYITTDTNESYHYEKSNTGWTLINGNCMIQMAEVD